MKLFNQIKGLTSYIISFLLSSLMLFILPVNAFAENRMLTIIVFIAFTSVYFLFISEKGKSIIQKYYSNPIVISITILVLINLSYIIIKSFFSSDFFLKSVIAFMIPLAFLLIKKEQEKFHLLDIFVLIIGISVVLFKLLYVKLIAYQDTISFNLGYSFVTLYLLFIFAGYRKIDIGLNFRINFKMLGETVIFALILIIINIIIGLNLKFISFPQNMNFDYKNLVLYSIFMLFFASFSEELFFRGLILNYIKQFTGKYGNIIALILSSIIFGATHLGKFAVSMFLLATIAGIFYGLVYIRTKNLVCAAIIHTLTNLCWKLIFVTN
jgi:membrane protease YdiL (CAAX protease family)